MLIRAVLFDLYETLVTEFNQPLRRASSLATQLGVDEAAYKREWKSRRAENVLGRCSFHDALAQIAAKLWGGADESGLEGLRSQRGAQKSSVLETLEPGMLAAGCELRRQ